ncbi:MAG: 50S ribosomal protein L32 [Holosporales bacterium]|jgi:large subunit ribosomal protein L32|nr:50S ribosomal protein L32 [Holosporales bacterium]
MAVPKKKTSKSRRNMRRSHDGLRGIGVVECPNCGAFKRPHHCCASCGFYNDISIISKTEKDSETE